MQGLTLMSHLKLSRRKTRRITQQPMTQQAWALDGFRLTRREAEVLHLVAEGKRNAEIGAVLGLSPRTVEKHLEHIYHKLGVQTRTAAALSLLHVTLQVPVEVLVRADIEKLNDVPPLVERIGQ